MGRPFRTVQIPGGHRSVSCQVRHQPKAGRPEAVEAGRATSERGDGVGVREPLLGDGPKVPEVGQRQPAQDTHLPAHQ
jgi:hypothetical protein